MESHDAKHIGRGVIDGHECEHLAFRTPDADWQIWIEPGATPIPRKYIITTKTVTGAPQYTLRIGSWKTSPDTTADAFAFKPSADMKREIQNLGHIDEILRESAPAERRNDWIEKQAAEDRPRNERGHPVFCRSANRRRSRMAVPS